MNKPERKRIDMRVQLPFGSSTIETTLPDTAHVVEFKTNDPPVDISSRIAEALTHPIGCPKLGDLARGRKKAVIVINDATRPAPSDLMLKALLAELSRAGIPHDRVTAVIACGNHRPCTDAEIKQMLGPDLARLIRVENHDAGDKTALTKVGTTETGLPVWINKTVANADLKILTGLIAPHPSAGFSGGRKSLLPGVAGLDSIRRHHSFPFRPFHPAYGWMKGNPFHEESVRIARKAGIDFILNVVQDLNGRFFAAVAGELEAAHEKGVEMGRPFWRLTLPRKYDVLVVTPGGHPRDLDLHQAQKAVSTAETFAAPEGIIVLLAQCRDGLGKWPAKWLKEAKSPGDVIHRFEREGFTQDHTSKDFMCARALARHQVIVHCDGIREAELRDIFFTPAKSAQHAIDLAIKNKGKNAAVLVLPKAVNCMPEVKQE